MKISTREIKSLIIKCVSELEFCSASNLKHYVIQNTTKEVTDPQISGAIQQLLNKDILQKVERGIYKLRKYEDVSLPFDKRIKECLAETVQNLSTIVKHTDITTLDDQDFKTLNRIKTLREQIELIIEDIK